MVAIYHAFLQFLPRASNAESHVSDGSWPHTTRLEFGGVGGTIGNEKVWGSCGMISQVRMFALGTAWVGGWGFLFFTNPQLICKLFRVKDPTPKRLRAIKITGAIELALVFTGCVLTAVFGMPSP